MPGRPATAHRHTPARTPRLVQVDGPAARVRRVAIERAACQSLSTRTPFDQAGPHSSIRTDRVVQRRANGSAGHLRPSGPMSAIAIRRRVFHAVRSGLRPPRGRSARRRPAGCARSPDHPAVVPGQPAAVAAPPTGHAQLPRRRESHQPARRPGRRWIASDQRRLGPLSSMRYPAAHRLVWFVGAVRLPQPERRPTVVGLRLPRPAAHRVRRRIGDYPSPSVVSRDAIRADPDGPASCPPAHLVPILAA
jgi:hypothetical protein